MRNNRLEKINSEERSVVVLALIVGLLYVACFAFLLAVPAMPVEVQEARASLPSSPSAAGTRLVGQ
jgi:hypothetical protein